MCVAANAMVVVQLKKFLELNMFRNETVKEKANKLQMEIETAIELFGTVEHPIYGRIYAYEVDCFGSHYLGDDANIPSLLSLPYIGYCSPRDKT